MTIMADGEQRPLAAKVVLQVRLVVLKSNKHASTGIRLGSSSNDWIKIALHEAHMRMPPSRPGETSSRIAR